MDLLIRDLTVNRQVLTATSQCFPTMHCRNQKRQKGSLVLAYPLMDRPWSAGQDQSNSVPKAWP